METSRSNVSAVQHTAEQMYGEAITREGADLGVVRFSMGFQYFSA
jgi:hypothetical protein